MKPPTRIRDDAPSDHARALLDAARPVRAMTAAERAASAARVGQIGAAPSVAPAALWGKSVTGAAVVGMVSTLLALSGGGRPAAPPSPRPSQTPRAVVTPVAPTPRAVVIPVAPAPHAVAPPEAPLPPAQAPRPRPHPRLAAPPLAHPTPSPRPPVVSPSPTPTTLAQTSPSDAPRAVVTLGAPARPTAPPGASERTLDEETRSLLDARASLRDAPAEAARRLQEHRARFPDGRLAAERDALLFRTLADLGDRAGARAEGERFLRLHPRHPSAGAVRARLEGL